MTGGILCPEKEAAVANGRNKALGLTNQ